MTRCKVGALLGSLPTVDRATLAGWLDNGRDGHGRRVPADVLSQALTADGHAVGQSSLKAHRRGVCVCYRERTTP